MREAQLRPEDVRSLAGVGTSNPEPDYPVQPYAVETMHPDDEHNADPIPVIVVDTVTPSDFTDWGGSSFGINGDQPVMIAGARNNRTRLVVTNVGNKIVWLVRGSVASAFTGFPIPPSAVVEMTTNRDVYATCLAGDTTIVGALQEFVIDDD